MMPMGTPQQISSYQSLPPSLTAAPPQFQVNPSFAANTQYARMPYVGLPPTMGPIGLGAAPSMQAAVMQQQQQQPAVSNYTGMQRGVGGAGGGGGGGGGSGRKPSKAIRIVDPSTMKEVDLSVSGGAGGNPPPRSVSPANIPIRPPPAGGGSQPSTTAADTFRQQVLEKAQTGLIKPAPNAIIRPPKNTTKSHEGVEPSTEAKFGVPVTISAPPLTGPPLNIPPGVFLPPGTGIVQTQKPSRPHFNSVVPNPHAAAFHPAPPLAATGQLQSQPPKVHELPPVSGAGLLTTPNIPPRTAALTHEATNGHAMLPHSLAAPIPSAGATGALNIPPGVFLLQGTGIVHPHE